MNEHPKANRGDSATLVPAAQQLYAAGKTRSEVLEAIYGVDLPREAVLFHREFVLGKRPIEFEFLTHPWELMISPEHGGPRATPDPITRENEAKAFAQAPNVLLLGATGYADARHGDSLLGYDLDELRAGRSTIVGLPDERDVPDDAAEFVVFGSSLLDVFHECLTDYHRLMKHWLGHGRFSYTRSDLAEVEDQLDIIEALKTEVARGGAPARR